MTVDDQRPSSAVAPFGALGIEYDDRVLAPRSWTELQSGWAAELAATGPPGQVLELCAGAGQIGLLAVLGSRRSLVMVDLNEVACGFAERNARAAGLADRVEVRNRPLEEACEPGEVFAIILADPPWVPTAQVDRFPEDPRSAIDGGADGLDVADACLRVIAAHLHPRGSALLQLGSTDQVASLRARMSPLLRIDGEREESGRGVVVRVVPNQPQATSVPDPAAAAHA